MTAGRWEKHERLPPQRSDRGPASRHLPTRGQVPQGSGWFWTHPGAGAVLVAGEGRGRWHCPSVFVTTTPGAIQAAA